MTNELKQKEGMLFKSAKEKALTVMKLGKGYMIVDYYTSRIIAGWDYSMTIEEVEKYLAEYYA